MIGLPPFHKFDVSRLPNYEISCLQHAPSIEKWAKLLGYIVNNSAITLPFHGGLYLFTGLIKSHYRPIES